MIGEGNGQDQMTVIKVIVVTGHQGDETLDLRQKIAVQELLITVANDPNLDLPAGHDIS